MEKLLVWSNPDKPEIPLQNFAILRKKSLVSD